MILILTLFVLIIDISSKILIYKMVELEESIPIIRNVFNITYVRNTGVAFSIFNNKIYLIIIISALIIMSIIWYLCKNKPDSKCEKVAYSFILGGAIGNFINRCACGYVTDFIDIKIFGYNYPIFNLADMFIVIGVMLLLICTWRCNNGDKSNR